MKLRIQKYISECGVLSRRAAERAIEEKRVKVNGVLAETGMQIDDEDDVVELDGVPVVKNAGNIYLLLNKPAGVLSAVSDERGRLTVSDLLSELGRRVYPAGRLDMDSEGALICTDDGDFANRIMHPSHKFEKVYIVHAAGNVPQSAVEYLNSMRVLDGEPISKVKVSVVNRRSAHTVLQFVLREGKNRQIRRMCDEAGVKLTQLKRIAVGAVRLGTLKSGQWRMLTREEIRSFKK